MAFYGSKDAFVLHSIFIILDLSMLTEYVVIGTTTTTTTHSHTRKPTQTPPPLLLLLLKWWSVHRTGGNWNWNWNIDSSVTIAGNYEQGFSKLGKYGNGRCKGLLLLLFFFGGQHLLFLCAIRRGLFLVHYQFLSLLRYSTQ